jgi:curved DNA-binding protein CbpA
MSLGEGQLAEWKQAYRVLGVPLNSSAHSIKQTYRRLSKRWHPDLYAGETPAHVEAARMMTLINEAYSAIANAPLRYHIETYPQRPSRQSGQTTKPSANEPTGLNSQEIPKTDKLEFWVRFACGGVFGIFVSLNLVMSAMPDSAPSYRPFLALGVLGVVLGSGFAAARYGDKFWYSILRRWWLWW